MKWTQEHIDRIQHLLPNQHGNVESDYLSFFQALQSIAENGCQWRALPKKFGNWNTIYYRFRYWIDRGIFDRIDCFAKKHEELQSQAIAIKGIGIVNLI